MQLYTPMLTFAIRGTYEKLEGFYCTIRKPDNTAMAVGWGASPIRAFDDALGRLCTKS